MSEAILAALPTCWAVYVWASLLIYFSEAFLRPINKKCWARHYYVLLLSIVFAPHRLVRQDRKIKHPSELHFHQGTRIPHVLPFHILITEQLCQARAIHCSCLVTLPHLFLSFPLYCYKSRHSCLSEFQSIYKMSEQITGTLSMHTNVIS